MFTKIENIKKEGNYLVLGNLSVKNEKGVVKFKIEDGQDVKADMLYGTLPEEVLERKQALIKVSVSSTKGYKKGEIIEIVDEKIEQIIEKIQDEAISSVVKEAISSLKEDIAKARVTQMSCYSSSGDLIEHIVNVTKLTIGVAEAVEGIYGEKIEKDLLIASAIIHDIGKAYALDEAGKTHEGLLLGETLLTLKAIDPFLSKLDKEVRLKIEHIICSCKNEPNHGAISIPRTKEAVVFALIEKMDISLANFMFMESKNMDTLFSKKYVL